MFLKFIKKGVELEEKLMFLSEGQDTRLLIPEDKHIIKDSIPQQVGILWVEELFQKVEKLEEIIQFTPLFDFEWNECSMYIEDFIQRFSISVTDKHWNLTFYDIIAKKHHEYYPLNIWGVDNESYSFRQNGSSIKSLDSYMERLWRYFTWKSKQHLFDANKYDELDWEFYLRALFLLIELFPNVDIGIQGVFEKFNKREENNYGEMNYKFPWN